jgi:hypothetical protein
MAKAIPRRFSCPCGSTPISRCVCAPHPCPRFLVVLPVAVRCAKHPSNVAKMSQQDKNRDLNMIKQSRLIGDVISQLFEQFINPDQSTSSAIHPSINSSTKSNYSKHTTSNHHQDSHVSVVGWWTLPTRTPHNGHQWSFYVMLFRIDQRISKL